MKGIKKALLIVLIFLAGSTLFAVSFSTSILNISSDTHLLSNFGSDGILGGFFPLEAEYRYKTTLPEFMRENGYSLNLDFSSGIKERLLKVNPDNGEVLMEERSSLFYQVHYIYLNIDFSKALIRESYMNEDILALHFSILADYENAYERFGYLSNPVKNTGAFSIYNEDTKRIESRYHSFEYIPELMGNKRLSHTGMGLSLTLNWKEETEMTKDGIWGEVSLEYMPSWMPFHEKDDSDYLSIYLNGGIALTFLEMSQMSFGPTNGLDALAMYAETDFSVLGTIGNNIPQLAVDKRVWGTDVPSSHVIVSNKTTLVINGYQFMKDLYPSLSIFSDMAFAFGGGINGVEGGNGFVGSLGARFDFNIFSMFSLYGEIGYVYKDLYDRNPGFRYSLGAKVRI